jgi:hypothetical protein
MKQTLYFTAPPAAPRARGKNLHHASMLDVCAALIFTLAGLLGREGTAHGE